MDFEQFLNERIESIEFSTTREAMRYSLLAGGKRLRPKMLFSVMEGYGVSPENGMHLAAALEMIHTYSLIHDDLPAMDNDDLRRGRPTCHKQYNEAVAILAGDGLLTFAFRTACDAPISADQKVNAVCILSENAGAGGMVLGQDLDILAEGKTLTWNEVERIHYYKTGCLFSAALMLGALSAGCDKETLKQWDLLGKEIGLAFQIQDDILDVKSSPEKLGKSNSDARNDKSTSVNLLGLEEAERKMNELYHDSMEKLNNMREFNPSSLITLIESISKRNY